VIAFANADFEQCEAGAAAHDRPGDRAASTPRPGWCCSTCTAPPASSSASRAWRSTTRSSSAGRRRSGTRCPSWWPRRPATSRPVASSRAGRRRRLGRPAELDIDAVARCVRRRCRCRCPGSSTGAAAPHRPRGGDAAVDAVPAVGRARRWRCAGSAGDQLFTVLQEPPHRRARCRPGLLADAAGGAAPGQPRRPVRRGGHRLLRHLRGVAAVLGAGALQGAHRRHRRVDAPPPMSSVSDRVHRLPRVGLLDDEPGRQVATSSCRASWWATSAPP
jgi:hypothetical protein